MAVAYNSRYRETPVVTIPYNGSVRNVLVPGEQEAFSFTYFLHIISDGERLDTMAALFYDDPTMWWVIADANPEVLDWTFLPAGAVVRIPNI